MLKWNDEGETQKTQRLAKGDAKKKEKSKDRKERSGDQSIWVSDEIRILLTF